MFDPLWQPSTPVLIPGSNFAINVSYIQSVEVGGTLKSFYPNFLSNLLGKIGCGHDGAFLVANANSAK
jgi:hypothetical protein